MQRCRECLEAEILAIFFSMFFCDNFVDKKGRFARNFPGADPEGRYENALLPASRFRHRSGAFSWRVLQPNRANDRFPSKWGHRRIAAAAELSRYAADAWKILKRLREQITSSARRAVVIQDFEHRREQAVRRKEC